MDTALYHLLRNIAVTSSARDEYSHVTKSGQDGQLFYWLLNQECYGSFWKGICELVRKDFTANFSIAEPPSGDMPHIIDMFLPFQSMEGEPYDEELLQLLTCCYQKAMQETLLLNDDDREFVCFVMETPQNYYDELKHLHYMRIRLQFLCRSNVQHQEKETRVRFIHHLRDLNVMSRFNPQPSADWEQIIIKDNLRKPVIMYGSEMAYKQPKLKHVHTYGHIKRVTYDDDDWSLEGTEDLNIDDYFTPKEHLDCQRGFVSLNLFATEPPSFWLPFLLSINYGRKVTLPRQAEKPVAASKPLIPPVQDDNNPLTIARTLLPYIKADRYTNKLAFTQIGSALYHSSNGEDTGLNLWKERTQTALLGSPGAKDCCSSLLKERLAQCDQLYLELGRNHYTVKSIAWFAKEDDPIRYHEWHKQWYTRALERAKSSLHADVAEALYRIYWLEYVCVPIGNGHLYKWYQFSEHRWKDIGSGNAFRAKIKDEFLKKITRYREDITLGVRDRSDEGLRAAAEATVKKLDTLINKLGSTPYKNTIMREIQEYFEHRSFIQILDSNINLTGIRNGVIEVCEDVATVRRGRPEDFISLSTGVIYLENYHIEHDKVRAVLYWMKQTFGGDAALIHHFRKLISSSLRGKNAAKMFPIWSGKEGDNSKSAWIKAFKSFLGPYCTVTSVASISVNERSASNATPEMARLKAVRFTFLNEPDPEEKLKGGKIKARTGGDSVYARGLFSDGGEQEQTDTLIMVCNLIPYIPAADKVTKKRTEIFDFNSQWVDHCDAPKDPDEQLAKRKFPKDPFFEEKVPSFASALLWLAVDGWSIYYHEGMTPKPECVTKANSSYWRDTDIYLQFIDDCIVWAKEANGEKDKKARLTFLEVLEAFEAWRKKWYPSAPATRSTVRTSLIDKDHIGPLDENNSWSGIRLNNGGTPHRTASKE